MSEERDILLQLRHAKQNLEHAEALLIQSGLTPITEFQNYIKSAIDNLKTAHLIFRGEGRERG